VGLLKSGEYITMDEDGGITLTPAGHQIAEKILSRHTLLTQLLEHLGVDRQTASADACKMEHVISDETFEAFQKHMQAYENK
jgi:Mn-dependent DtxR family transcriptional regulator